MFSRRRFLALLGAALATSRIRPVRTRESSYQVYLPLIHAEPAPDPTPGLPPEPPLEPLPTPAPNPPPIGDPAPWTNEEGYLLAPPSGAVEQAIRWFAARSTLYTRYDITQIVNAYARIGNEAGVDWFLALAQCAHETGSLTSWWCARPRRNPAGIGVTGAILPGVPDAPPGRNWAWDGAVWREGASFPAWDSEAISAHLGRLLAYALPQGAESAFQRTLIEYALWVRDLPPGYRGIATTITDLNGRWAVPGVEYGQRILDLARRMRSG